MRSGSEEITAGASAGVIRAATLMSNFETKTFNLFRKDAAMLVISCPLWDNKDSFTFHVIKTLIGCNCAYLPTRNSILIN